MPSQTFTLDQVQFIYNNTMKSYFNHCKSPDQPYKIAVHEAAKAAAAVTTTTNAQAKMAEKVTECILTACMEAVIVNSTLSKDKYRVAFDAAFVQFTKAQLEKLFNVAQLTVYQSEKTASKLSFFSIKAALSQPSHEHQTNIVQGEFVYAPRCL